MVHRYRVLPIRKTNSTTVLLSSYSGKLFIVKNVYKRHRPSEWLFTQIIHNDDFTNIITSHNAPYDLDLPSCYSLFSNKFLRFKYLENDLIFDYKNRLVNVPQDEQQAIKNYETDNKLIYIGVCLKEREYRFMDRKNNIISTNLTLEHKLEDKPTEVFFGGKFNKMSFSKMPIEYASIKVFNKTMPLGLVMMYYLGIDELFSKLNAEYRKEDVKYKLMDNEYEILLNDCKLILDKSNPECSILISGIKDTLKELNLAELNNKVKISSFFNTLDLPISYSNELDNIESLHIDNLTRDALRSMHEPTNIHDLLIRASEMLTDDNYKNPNNILDNAIKQYERIPGLVYNRLAGAIREYNNKNVFSKAKISLDPYSIWKAIGDDSTSMLVDDTNPLAKIKQDDNVTFLGEFGRSKITMTIPTRIMTPDEIGIISESTPDSGDSGINTYLVHNAEIINLRGMVKPIDTNETTLTKALSTVNIVTPATNKDD